MSCGGRGITRPTMYGQRKGTCVSRAGASILRTSKQLAVNTTIARGTWSKVQAPIVGMHRIRFHRRQTNTASKDAIARTLARTSSSLYSTKRNVPPTTPTTWSCYSAEKTLMQHNAAQPTLYHSSPGLKVASLLGVRDEVEGGAVFHGPARVHPAQDVVARRSVAR